VRQASFTRTLGHQFHYSFKFMFYLRKYKN
jgi:hypothetical protein